MKRIFLLLIFLFVLNFIYAQQSNSLFVSNQIENIIEPDQNKINSTTKGEFSLFNKKSSPFCEAVPQDTTQVSKGKKIDGMTVEVVDGKFLVITLNWEKIRNN